MTEVIEPTDTELELDALKEQAKLLGIKHHPSIGADALSAKIKEHLDKEDSGEPAEEPEESQKQSAAKSKAQVRLEKKRDAERQVRIQITCMDPKRSEWEGEVFTAGNSLLGSYRKMVPFNVPWHVPNIIYKQIKAAKCQVFHTVIREVHGKKVKQREGKLINAFAVEVLDPLTEEQLQELARSQAMRGAVE